MLCKTGPTMISLVEISYKITELYNWFGRQALSFKGTGYVGEQSNTKTVPVMRTFLSLQKLKEKNTVASVVNLASFPENLKSKFDQRKEKKPQMISFKMATKFVPQLASRIAKNLTRVKTTMKEKFRELKHWSQPCRSLKPVMFRKPWSPSPQAKRTVLGYHKRFMSTEM